MSHTTRRPDARPAKVGLLIGYLGLILAVVVANRTPADGYEIALYGATPPVVWVALAIGLAVGAVVAFTTRPVRATHTAALGLIGAVTMTVVAMPLLRGYTFYGPGDSLSHVGWAREIAAGTLAPTDLLYPGIHTLTVFVARTADVAPTHANLYVVLVAFPLVFLLFVPASVRLVAPTPGAYAVSLLAAAAFVPINNIAVHSTAHPASQTILLFAFVLFIALAHVADGLDPRFVGGDARQSVAGDARRSVAGDGRSVGDGGRRSPTVAARSPGGGTGALFLLAVVAIVLVHPQQALNVAIFLGGMAAIQLAVGRFWGDHPLAATPSLLPATAVLIGAFLVWTPRFERARGAVEATVGSLFTAGPTGATVVGAKSTSLTTVGGSLAEVFLKLFGGATVLSLFALAALLVGVWRHRRAPLALLLAAGLVPVFGLFLVVFAAGLGDMYFRYHGFLMVPVAVLGVAGLVGLRDRLASTGRGRAGAVVALVVLLVIVPTGLAVVHPSPYVYQPSKHVSTEQLDGYGAAFEARDPDVPFTGLRGGPRRYVDYHYGTENARERLAFPGYREGIPPAVFAAGNYSSAFERDRYVAITDASYQQEVELYDGLRYGDRGFRALETTPGVDRVRANDGFRLYRVDGGE